MIKVMVTGHRPNRIGGYDENNPVRQYTSKAMTDILIKLKTEFKNIEAITGMALGVDQDYCKICIKLNIPFIAYIPFVGQELKWPSLAQDQYRDLLSKAKKVIIVSKGNYSPRKMLIRDERMVKDCDVGIAIWDGIPNGGTYHTFNCLKQESKKIIHINPKDYNIS